MRTLRSRPLPCQRRCGNRKRGKTRTLRLEGAADEFPCESPVCQFHDVWGFIFLACCVVWFVTQTWPRRLRRKADQTFVFLCFMNQKIQQCVTAQAGVAVVTTVHATLWFASMPWSRVDGINKCFTLLHPRRWTVPFAAVLFVKSCPSGSLPYLKCWPFSSRSHSAQPPPSSELPPTGYLTRSAPDETLASTPIYFCLLRVRVHLAHSPSPYAINQVVALCHPCLVHLSLV